MNPAKKSHSSHISLYNVYNNFNGQHMSQKKNENSTAEATQLQKVSTAKNVALNFWS